MSKKDHFNERQQHIVSMTTRFAVSPDVCSSSTNDGSTILHIQKGVLYSLIGVSSVVWTMLACRTESVTLSEIVSRLRADFPEVPEETIRCDAENLLSQLAQKGIVELRDEKPNRLNRVPKARLSSLFENFSGLTVNGFLKLKFTFTAAFVELTLVDLTLTFGGFHALHRLVKQWPIASGQDSESERVQKVCAAVDQATTRYPKHALCLQRSAATTCLLRSYGVPAQMVIACRKTPFEGHAWVEVGDEVVNDSQKVKAFYNSVLGRC